MVEVLLMDSGVALMMCEMCVKTIPRLIWSFSTYTRYALCVCVDFLSWKHRFCWIGDYTTMSGPNAEAFAIVNFSWTVASIRIGWPCAFVHQPGSIRARSIQNTTTHTIHTLHTALRRPPFNTIARFRFSKDLIYAADQDTTKLLAAAAEKYKHIY